MYRLVLITIFIGALAPAQAQTFKVSDLQDPLRQPACHRLISFAASRLENVGPVEGLVESFPDGIPDDFELPSSAFPSDLEMSVENIVNLEMMLERVHTPKEERGEILELFRWLKRQDKKSKLGKIARSLSNESFNDRLFAILVGEQNRMPAGTAAYFDPLMMNLELIRSGEPFKERKFLPSSPRSLHTKIALIFLQVPYSYLPEFRALAFVSTLAHEYQHFLDYVLLTKWIRANRLLIHCGLAPDRLFSRYVNFYDEGRPDEVILINSGFFYSFLESGGYEAQTEVLRAHLAPAKFDQLSKELMKHALTDVREANGEFVLKAENADPSELYEVGSKWRSEMRATILKAKPFGG